MLSTVCPRCGAPARVALCRRELVRVELNADGTLGRVLSHTRETKVVEGYECGGAHQWFVDGCVKRAVEDS